MHSSGSPVLTDSSGESLDSEPHVIHRTLPAHMEAARHVTSSTRTLLDMAYFNQLCRPSRGRECVLHATTQSRRPSDEEAETLPPVWDRTPQLWCPPNWERSCLLQTSLTRLPSVFPKQSLASWLAKLCRMGTLCCDTFKLQLSESWQL